MVPIPNFLFSKRNLNFFSSNKDIEAKFKGRLSTVETKVDQFLQENCNERNIVFFFLAHVQKKKKQKRKSTVK